MPPILLAHADIDGEAERARPIAEALRKAGYEVVYGDTILVGDSLHEEASKALAQGSPVVLCGTIMAIGTGFPHRLFHAASQYASRRTFALRMDKQAYVEQLTQNTQVAEYWQDPHKAIADLITALGQYYPADLGPAQSAGSDLESRYRELALRTYNIIDLANLPVTEASLATRELQVESLYVALRIGAEHLGRRASKAAESGKQQETSVPQDEPFVASDRWSIGELLAKARRLVLLGDPGAGKSTLLRWLATAYLLRLNANPSWHDLPDVTDLPDEDWLPILIRCRELEDRRATKSLESVLEHHVRNFGIVGADAAAATKLLLDRLTAGKALLLLDGLDEITDPRVRAQFCRWIEGIHIAHPKAPIIATSRIVGYKEMRLRIGRGFQHGTVLDLTAKDKDDFARRWCALTEPGPRRAIAESELIRDIHSTNRIERLTGNPMLLTTMALVKKKVGKLPSKRADLYREAVDVLLNWRSDVDELLDRDEAIPQLEYIAYAMCGAGVQQLRTDEITRLLSQMRAEFPNVRAARKHDPAEFLSLIQNRTAIVHEVGKVRHNGHLIGVWEFRHLTFQEYLAGLALVDGRFPGRDRQLTLAERISPLAAPATRSPRDSEGVGLSVSENWLEALRLCIMSCNDDDVDSALLAIANVRDDEDPSVTARPRIILAASCLADEPNVTDDAAATLIKRIPEVLLGRGASENFALKARIEMDDRQVLRNVGASLWGPQLSRQFASTWVSASEYSSIMEDYALQTIRPRIPNDPAELPTWTTQAVRYLESTEQAERALGALSLASFSTRRIRRRRRSVPAARGSNLTILNGSRLLAMLDNGDREAEAAALAIGRLAGPAASTVSLQLAVEEKSEIVIRIKGRLLTRYAVDFVIPALEHDGQTDQKLARAIVDYALMSSNRNPLRHYSRLSPDYAEPIIDNIADASVRLLYAMIRILEESSDPAAPQALLSLSLDPSSPVRIDAAIALGEKGDTRAIAPLIDTLLDMNETDLISAAEILARFGDKAAIGPLSEVSDKYHFVVRMAILGALAALGDTASNAKIRGLMRDGAEDVRRDALWGMARHEADKIDRVLLSADNDGVEPGIDPRALITPEGLEERAEDSGTAGLSVHEARERYERLQKKYQLPLAWKARPSRAKTATPPAPPS